MSALVTTRTRSAGTAGASRAMVSAMSGRSLTSGSTCLGRLGVASGQKRVPIPPAKTTAQSVVSVSRCGSGRGASRVALCVAEPTSAPGAVESAGGTGDGMREF